MPEGLGQAGGREAQVVLRGDPWAPESSSPTGATKLGLVVGQGAFACLGCGPDSGAAGAGQGTQSWGAAASPFGTSFLLPWVSHFVQHGNPKEARESTSHYPANKATGKGKRMKGLGVLNFGFGVFSWFEKIIKVSCFCNPINFKPRIQIINSQQ